MKRLTWIVPTVYILLLLLPIYWLVTSPFGRISLPLKTT